MPKLTDPSYKLEDHVNTIKYIASRTLKSHPTYRYLKEDIVSECYVFFYDVVKKYDPNRSSITFHSYLCYKIMFFVGRYIYNRKVETQQKFKYSLEPRAQDYTDNQVETKDTLQNICQDLTEQEMDYVIDYYMHSKTCHEIGLSKGVTRQAISLQIIKIKKKITNSIKLLDKEEE